MTAALATTGCVERLITIKTAPEGAMVWLNNEEVGTSPLTVPFTWYGAYEVTLRKDGYQTVHTSQAAEAPLYQWPGLDLLFECLLPVNLVDEHTWQFELTQQDPTDPNTLIERAKQLQAQTLADS